MAAPVGCSDWFGPTSATGDGTSQSTLWDNPALQIIGGLNKYVGWRRFNRTEGEVSLGRQGGPPVTCSFAPFCGSLHKNSDGWSLFGCAADDGLDAFHKIVSVKEVVWICPPQQSNWAGRNEYRFNWFPVFSPSFGLSVILNRLPKFF